MRILATSQPPHTTQEVADLEPLADKFRAFGLHTTEVDGHDVGALSKVLVPDDMAQGPRAIAAKTRKGCGVSFMEGRMEWHYLPLTAAQYEAAVKDIERRSDEPG